MEDQNKNVARRKCILIVDDMELNRQIMKLTFENEYEILEATDGVQALALLRQTQVDLVITDIMMQPMDGYELIRAIRAEDALHNLPVVAVTEHDEVMQQKVLSAGADDFICKPFARHSLLRCIGGLLLGDAIKGQVELYRRVFDHNPIAFMLYRLVPDETGAYTGYQVEYANQAALDLLCLCDNVLEGETVMPFSPRKLEVLIRANNARHRIHETQYDKHSGKHLDLTMFREFEGYVSFVVTDITERVRQEQAVKTERDRYSHLLDAIPGGIAVFRTVRGKPSEIQYINEELSDIVGYSRGELLARGAELLCEAIPEDREATIALARRAIDRAAPAIAEYRTQRKDGTIFYVQARMSMERLSADTVVTYVTYTDVTDRRRAQAVLEENSAMYQLITQYTDINIWEYDIAHDVLYNTENSVRVHPGAEKTIVNFEDTVINAGMVRADSIEDFRRMYRKLRQGAPTVTGDIWFRGENSRGWWCERIIYVAMPSAQGQPTRAIGIGKNITQEVSARMASQKYQILLDNSDVAIWEYHMQTRQLALPQSGAEGERMIDLADWPAQMIPHGRLCPDVVETYQQLFVRIDEGAAEASAEICVVGDRRKRTWFRVNLRAIPRVEKLPGRAILWCVNVTSYKEAEQNFEEEAAYLAGGQENALLGKCRANITQNLVDHYTGIDRLDFNAQASRYSDAVEYVAGLCATREMAMDFRRKMASASLLERYRTGEQQLRIDYIRHMRGGGAAWVRTVVKTFADPVSGDVMCFMYTYDIDREKTMQLIVDHVSVHEFDLMALLYVDEDRLHCVRYSPMEEQIRCGAEVLYSESLPDFIRHYLPAELQAEALERFQPSTIQAALAEQASWIISYPVIFEGQRRQKKWEFSYLDESHATIIFTRSDVTELFEEQARQREVLRNALLQAEQASKAKTDFLSHMSHEIRTPMNAIIGMSTLAAQCVSDPQQVSECISKIGISARFLLSLINDILDMSRIESGKVTLKEEKFPFEEFIGNINSIIYNQARDKGLDYDCVINSFTAPYYIGDATKLQQVLVNLLGNAVKFTPPGGKTQLIVHQVKQENGKAQLSFTVNDTGIGISEEFQQRMFDPFEQANVGITTPYQGTGLGLAICKNLISMMGGIITVNSIEGIGSEFTVNVPLGVCEEEMPATVVKNIPFEKLQALIVDDDVVICEHTQVVLHEMGVRAEWVSSGAQAIAIVKQWQTRSAFFDVILLDWKMPDMDGIETARRIRAMVGAEVTIIVITAYDWMPIEQEAKAAGVNLLITKPLFKSTLMSAFQRVYTEKEEKNNPPEQKRFDFAGKRILLVEDHILNVEVAKRLLESKHATVEVAENGLRALELFTTAAPGHYDVILMDIRMPIMDGLTAARSIRHLSKPGAGTVPIIAMSANAFDEDVEKSRAAGMNAHLSKPIEPQMLFATLDKFMQEPLSDVQF